MKQGDIFWLEGRTVDEDRPAVILTRSSAIEHLHSVIVAPITSNRRGVPTQVDVGVEHGLDKPSAINLENLTYVDRNRLVDYMGKLDSDALNSVYEALHFVLDLPY